MSTSRSNGYVSLAFFGYFFVLKTHSCREVVFSSCAYYERW